MSSFISDATSNTSSTTPSRRWFGGAALLGGLTLLAGGARAQGMGGGGRGWGHHGMMDPENMAKRVEHRIGKLIADVGGTPEQKDKLVALARATLADLKPLREQHMAARRQGMVLLTAPSIDRGALEQLRVSQMQAADAMSQRTLKAMADAAEVLSAEQRSRLAERMTQRMNRRGHGG